MKNVSEAQVVKILEGLYSEGSQTAVTLAFYLNEAYKHVAQASKEGLQGLKMRAKQAELERHMSAAEAILQALSSIEPWDGNEDSLLVPYPKGWESVTA